VVFSVICVVVSAVFRVVRSGGLVLVRLCLLWVVVVILPVRVMITGSWLGLGGKMYGTW